MKSPSLRSAWLPCLGLIALTTGAALRLRVPNPERITADQQRIDELTGQIAELQQQPLPSAQALSDELPTHYSLSQLLDFLESTQKALRIENLHVRTPEVASITQPSQSKALLPGGQQRAPGASPTAEINTPAAPGGAAVQTPRVTPELVHCELELEVDFATLVHFLGAIEASTPSKRLRALTIEPKREGVRASCVVEAYYLPDRQAGAGR